MANKGKRNQARRQLAEGWRPRLEDLGKQRRRALQLPETADLCTNVLRVSERALRDVQAKGNRMTEAMLGFLADRLEYVNRDDLVRALSGITSGQDYATASTVVPHARVEQTAHAPGGRFLGSTDEAYQALTSVSPQMSGALPSPIERSPFSGGRARIVRSLREHYPDALYSFGNVCADTICLEGVADETFPAHRLHVSVDESYYTMPSVLLEDRVQNERRVIALWASRYPELNNGDCVRLADYHRSMEDPEDKKYLTLHIARMKWFDYMFANQRFGDAEFARLFSTTFDVSEFVDFARLAEPERTDVTASQLSNIVPVYVSATTIDGYLMYLSAVSRWSRC